MNTWGISGWQPNWLASSKSLLNLLRQHIFTGSQVSQTITLWEANDWFEDAPIIIVIDGVQHEFCANKIGEFSYSKNTIDKSKPVKWCDASYGIGTLRWKTNAHPNLKGLTNNTIIDIGTIEYLLDENIQCIFDKDWALSGVYVRCSHFYAEIYNALDCNAVRNSQQLTNNFRYTSMQ